MPKVKNVEKRIWEVEDFDVNFLHPDGTNVKGSKQGIPQYPHERKSRNECTVS